MHSPTVQILPGVAAIECFDCRKLAPHTALAGICGQPLDFVVPLDAVEFVGEPECMCTTEKVNGDRVDTATLKFRSTALLPLHLPLGFVVTTPAGARYLIGAREKPYTRIKAERHAGTPSGTPAGYAYEVTHTARMSLIPCRNT